MCESRDFKTCADILCSFRERARIYKAKVKAGTNTDEDDIAFITAREKEEANIKRAESDRLHWDEVVTM